MPNSALCFLTLGLISRLSQAIVDCNIWDTYADYPDFFVSPYVYINVQRENSESGLHVSKTYDEDYPGRGRILITVCSDRTGTNPAVCRYLYSHYCLPAEMGIPNRSGSDKARYADWDLH